MDLSVPFVKNSCVTSGQLLCISGSFPHCKLGDWIWGFPLELSWLGSPDQRKASEMSRVGEFPLSSSKPNHPFCLPSAVILPPPSLEMKSLKCLYTLTSSLFSPLKSRTYSDSSNTWRNQERTCGHMSLCTPPPQEVDGKVRPKTNLVGFWNFCPCEALSTLNQAEKLSSDKAFLSRLIYSF